jgi:hypothetical protein
MAAWPRSKHRISAGVFEGVGEDGQAVEGAVVVPSASRTPTVS